MSLEAKYNYYLEEYRSGNKENELARLAFQLFINNLPENKIENAKYKLADQSDIPQYGKLLLDFEKTNPSWSNKHLPYHSPFHDEILKRLISIEAIQDRFLQDIEDENYTNKQQFKKFFLQVYSLILLESNELEVFKKATSTKVDFSFDLDLEYIKKEAKKICDTVGTIDSEIKKLIGQIENNYKLDGYSVYQKEGVRYFSKKSDSEEVKKEYIFPHTKYLDVKNVYGKLPSKSNGHTSYVSNKEAFNIIFNLLQQRDSSFYQHVRNFYQQDDFNAYGKRVIHFYLTESTRITRKVFIKHPQILQEFSKVRNYIRKMYNNIYKTSSDSKEIESELKFIQKRIPLISAIIVELQKNVFGFSNDELQVVAKYYDYFKQKHDFYYYPPTKNRTEENQIKYHGTLADFFTVLKEQKTSSSDTKLHITFLTENEDLIRSLLSQESTSYETLRKNLRNILSTKKLLKLPDYLLNEMFEDDIVSNASEYRKWIEDFQKYL